MEKSNDLTNILDKVDKNIKVGTSLFFGSLALGFFGNAIDARCDYFLLPTTIIGTTASMGYRYLFNHDNKEVIKDNFLYHGATIAGLGSAYLSNYL